MHSLSVHGTCGKFADAHCLRYSKHNERVSVPNKEARAFLKLWASDKGLNDNDWRRLLEILDCVEMQDIQRGVSFADVHDDNNGCDLDCAYLYHTSYAFSVGH